MSNFSTLFRSRPYPSTLAYQKIKIIVLSVYPEGRAQQHDFRLLHLWFEKPTRDNLNDLRIQISLEEIQKIAKNQFCQIIKKAIQERALYLADMKGTKGQEMSYKELQMADYLLPSNQNVSLDD